MNILKLEKCKIENRQGKSFCIKKFTRKLPKGVTYCGYSPKDKMVEVQTEPCHKNKVGLNVFFGIEIAQADEILLCDAKTGQSEQICISAIETFNEKRTNYIRIVFDFVLPF